MKRAGRAYAPGAARGSALILSERLSFYGGVDSATGEIIDHAHPDRGRIITGRILVAPGGRGSSSSSSVLAEAIRLGTAPAGIVLGHPDPIMVIGCLVARRLYGLSVPIMVCPLEGLADGVFLAMSCDDAGAAWLDPAEDLPQTPALAGRVQA